jgi:hypothetical protein
MHARKVYFFTAVMTQLAFVVVVFWVVEIAPAFVALLTGSSPQWQAKSCCHQRYHNPSRILLIRKVLQSNKIHVVKFTSRTCNMDKGVRLLLHIYISRYTYMVVIDLIGHRTPVCRAGTVRNMLIAHLSYTTWDATRHPCRVDREMNPYIIVRGSVPLVCTRYDKRPGNHGGQHESRLSEPISIMDSIRTKRSSFILHGFCASLDLVT